MSPQKHETTAERRFHRAAPSLKRSNPAKLPAIVGYGAVFNRWTMIGGAFEECVRPGAFANALKERQDVRGLFNHDSNKILGRTTAGTLRLSVDSTGLAYAIDTPDTSYARDLVVSLGRGDISQSSFAFAVRPGGDVWTIVRGGGPDGGDLWRRELVDLDLFDVSPVAFPAYADATAGLRSKDFANALRSLDFERVKRGYPPLARPERDRARWLRLSLASLN